MSVKGCDCSWCTDYARKERELAARRVERLTRSRYLTWTQPRRTRPVPASLRAMVEGTR